MNITGSAFEQFEIIRIIPLHLFGNFDISITNSTIFMGIATIFFYVLFKNNSGLVVPGRWQSVLEILFENLYNVVRDNIGGSGAKYFPIIFSLFIFIAIMNLFGIIPYTFTPTAHIIVTFGISLSIFIAVTIIGLIRYRTDFFSAFMPAGSPLVLAGFLVIIEFVSYCAKAISLGVRLAANLTAGHLLFAILSGFTWKMLTSGGLIAIASIFPFMIIIFITVLELAVAIIQAYVFCLLTTIYINDSIHLH